MWYCIAFVVGIICTYIFNFFYYTTWKLKLDPREIIAIAFYSALPTLLIVAGFICAIYLLYFLYKLFAKKKADQEAAKIIKSAKIEADLIIAKANKIALDTKEDANIMAHVIKREALNMKEKVDAEQLRNELYRQNIEEEFQRKNQSRKEEQEGLIKQFNLLINELDKWSKSGNDKLRKQGREGAARRNEKKFNRLKEMVASLTQ